MAISPTLYPEVEELLNTLADTAPAPSRPQDSLAEWVVDVASRRIVRRERSAASAQPKR